jgi:hypothetical protein
MAKGKNFYIPAETWGIPLMQVLVRHEINLSIFGLAICQ